ncbi:glycosyltransferase involved in cell wall biosynthesis [Hydrogenoanaerobacterium saccharovorans]|uniref:Glycosyltransferase involved in cell wall bisynthesis n=1 Tax=Hydrogenoanaerobacterium saccharovorans TaxID=474960 RepID=A0A1H8ATZ3_9FIRM|nr:glycosyltransferase family 2 protein [Hydrogenoanaerobacterium saccharovorans]RPF47746.1 glycosyltransferase involved in cell wall biosynthesis [Hydrogenoanaerobacterium saccharovorans]SEM74271.1 Glycosyltransferase involved in cell wall bisynthesis [Hydrogenoanaerobacterium saccharovorans]
MQTLSLCMIVKDEEKYIEKCLNSVADAVDEIIIVDTGSTDHTLDIAKRFNPKIFSYKWDDNFSNARNEALKKATGDWILVLDADEVVYKDDLKILTEKIQTTKANGLTLVFHNLTNENSEEFYNMHTGLRLFKNKTFHYEGAIHEQLVPIRKSIDFQIELTDIRVLHYGYLLSNLIHKNKHERNIPIIQKLLDYNPNDAFQLFNMGNEYISQHDHNKALEYYEKAYANKDITLAYCPHLLFRRAVCLNCLQRNEESLLALSEALKIYPACTDYEYYKGIIYKMLKRYTLAIESFKKCIEMGAAPQNLTFLNDIHNFKPLIDLGQIYYLLDDWANCLDCYIRALQINSKRYDIIYKIGQILNKMLPNKQDVGKNLENLFSDSYYITNVLVIVDVLIHEGLYDEAERYFKRIENQSDYQNDKNFLQGKLLFYKKDYKSAYTEFLKIIEASSHQGILPNRTEKLLEYLTLCCFAGKLNTKKCNGIIQSLTNETEKQVLLYFLNKKSCSFDKTASQKIFNILSELLKVKELDIFETSLPILNLIDSNRVLLDLANVYYANGYKDMAVKNILESIKKFGAIDGEALYILNKEILQFTSS